MTTATYETDFYLWTQQQADLLRQGALSTLDTIHLIDELDDMGASNRRALGKLPRTGFAALAEMALSAGKARNQLGIVD